MCGDQVEDFRRIELAALRHHLGRALRQVRQDVESRAMGHRRRMHDTVLRANLIHVAEVAERHRQQVSMAKHGALRSPGGAAGIEEPRHVIRLAWNHCCRSSSCGDDARERRKLSVYPGHRLGQIAGDETQPGAAVLKNVRELLSVELGVDRHRHQPRVPDGEEQLDIGRMVVQDQRDAISGAQPALIGEVAGQHRGALRQVPVVVHQPMAGEYRRTFAEAAGRAQQEVRQIHQTDLRQRFARRLELPP